MDHQQLFVLQVWRDDARGVRVSVSRSTGESADWFADAVALWAHLVAAGQACGERPTPLTAREFDVALLFGDGCSHKFIAQRLGLAPATVRNHLSACYRKLGVHNRAALLRAMASTSGVASPVPVRADRLGIESGAASERPQSRAAHDNALGHVHPNTVPAGARAAAGR